VTRCENWPISWDWGSGSPGGGVPSDGFSGRWTARVSIDQGRYTFIARADDGVRVWLDNSLIIDAWRDQGPTEYRATRDVGSGAHDIKVEYYENGGGAVAQFRWERASTGGCTPNADQVALFVDGNFGGQCVVKGIGSYSNPAAIGLPNDAISSVRVGGNVRLTVYQHDNYAGNSSSFTGDDGNLGDNNIGNDSVSSARVESRSGGGTSNLARGKPAAASSQESSSYSPGRGNDGDGSTRWSSTISTTLGWQLWRVDLGSDQTFNRVRINWEAAYAARYRVVWSYDGTNWYYNNTEYTRGGSGWADHSFEARTRRYVGVVMMERAPRMNNYSFFEFEVYNGSRALHDGTTDPAPDATTLPAPGPEATPPDIDTPVIDAPPLNLTE
jgi:hypothetical protein